jgi:uncharacterized protein YodC (DUF2158 family)
MERGPMVFKIGDLVALKSGGPTMTVTRVDNLGIKTIVRCTWFVDNKMEQGNFPPEALVSAPPIAKKKVKGIGGNPGTSE